VKVTKPNFFIYPYTQHSAGSILLAEELDGKRVKLQNSSYTHTPDKILINWGNGNCPHAAALNPASAINEVINKVTFFKKLAGTGLTPPVAFTATEAKANLSYPIVCRSVAEGQDGEGIAIADTSSQVVPAKLYTQYIDKTSEYRIHMGRNQHGEIIVICRQKKSLSPEFTGDKRIWTGKECKLTYIETAVEPVIAVAKACFAKFPELTFGAFDIVYNNSTEQAYVLEINSAPMMNADTTQAYGDFFRTFQVKETPTPAATVTKETPSVTKTAPVNISPITGFVKAQLAAGHLTLKHLEAAYTPPKPTQEELIENYVNKIATS
jgi:hypothetical protein